MPGRPFDPRPTIRLDIGADETCLRVQTPGADARVFRLAVGYSGLFAGRDASGVPTQLAIEQAIQTVEDQIERVQRHLPRDADVVASAHTLAPLLAATPGKAQRPLTLDGVEHAYQLLAGRAMGAPSARGSGFDDPTGDALVLILRECMHHLGMHSLRIEP